LSALSLIWRILFFSFFFLEIKKKDRYQQIIAEKQLLFFLPSFVSWNALDAKGTKDKKENSSIGQM
jgi:hypothetical protein